MDSSSSTDSYTKTSAPLRLSEEEKRLLTKEGITLPSHYPLTKYEERELKRIRRKIRNKISAQDSRKRKKEYLDKLQARVTEIEEEKAGLAKKVRILEAANGKLSAQVKRLQQALQNAARSAANGR
jgi:cyclic AMP-responsive element-binding protein 3